MTRQKLFWLLLLPCLLALGVPAQSFAQVAFANNGAVATGTTSLSLAFPASISAGDLLVICMANKYPTNGPSTPSGWTLPTNGQGSGGAGVAGVDSGDVYATVFVKEATGSESGSETVTITSGNASYGFMARFTKTLATWSYAASNGADTSQDTTWSVTGGTDPGVLGGDLVTVCSGANGDLGLWSAHAMSQTGITYGAATEILDNATSTGDDVGTRFTTHAVTSGTSSGVPTYTATAAGGAAGASVIMRLRDSAAAPVPTQGFGWFFGGQ